MDDTPGSEARITLKNCSGADRCYFIFLDAPNVTGGEQTVFQSVYTVGVRAAIVRNGQGMPFVCSTKMFAVAGVTRGRRLGIEVTPDVTESQEVQLCEGDYPGSSVRVVGGKNSEVSIAQPSTLTCRVPGAFSVEYEDLELGEDATPFIGLGLRAPMDPSTIIPIATTEARPGVVNIIEPKHNKRFFISWGDYTVGQIVDVASLPEPALVDFNGRSSMSAAVKHRGDGRWDIQYMSVQFPM